MIECVRPGRIAVATAGPAAGAPTPAQARALRRRFPPRPGAGAQLKAFLAWVAGYDDNSSGGSRTLANHTAWLGRFTCPVLALRGDFTVAERVHSVQAKLRELELS